MRPRKTVNFVALEQTDEDVAHLQDASTSAVRMVVKKERGEL